MKVEIRLTISLHDEIIRDLSRPHRFAAERVGFATGRAGSLVDQGKLVLLNRYHSIPDDQYVDDASVGARIGSAAITTAMQTVYYGRPGREGIFHVHLHPREIGTEMSRVDRREIPRLMPGVQSVGRDAIHGIIILSEDEASAWVWLSGRKDGIPAETVAVIGSPLNVLERGSSDAH
jgi:hypothetical protein